MDVAARPAAAIAHAPMKSSTCAMMDLLTHSFSNPCNRWGPKPTKPWVSPRSRVADIDGISTYAGTISVPVHIHKQVDRHKGY